MLHQQHGRGVLAAKGCQTGQFADVFQIQLAQRGGGVQPQADGLRRGGVGRGPGIDGLPERGKIFFLYLNASRGGVAAEPRQILCTVGERTVQVERVRCAPAAAALALVHRDDDDRAAEPLHEPRRHDADNAGVPILAADDEHAVPGAGGVGLQRLQSSGKDLLFGLLALGVDLGQAFSYAGGLILVAAEQQFERYRGVVHAARSVQARGQTVADRVRRDGLAAAAGALQKRMQAGAHRVLQKGQTLADNRAVLPHQRHDVGHRTQRRQLAVHFQQLGGVAALERGTELERHARAAQVLERAFVVGALGVDNGDGVRQRVARQVVIRDDEVKAQLLCAGSFLDGGNAVVYRHDELEALGGQRFQRRACQTVAGAAGRQLAADVCALAGETFVQNGRGRDAIDVIVTVDDHEFLLFDGLLDTDDSLVHIGEQERVAQRFALAQQGLRSGGVRAAAGGQHPAQQYAAPGPGQRGFRRGVRLFQLPRRVIHTV